MNPITPAQLTWRLLTAGELTRVYLDEMRRDFPPTELKPLSTVLNSEAAGDAHTWGVFEGGTLVAYLLMVRPKGARVSQLDYFAVLPQYRASGMGAKLLAKLPELEGTAAILIESELPEKADDPAMAVLRVLRPLRSPRHRVDGTAVRSLVVPAAGPFRPGGPGAGGRRGGGGAGRLLPPHHG